MPTYEDHVHDRHDELYGATQRRVHEGTGGAEGAEPVAAAQVENGLPEPPPRTGAGSGRDAWEAYAVSLGLTVDDDMGRDDIVALVDEHTKE